MTAATTTTTVAAFATTATTTETTFSALQGSGFIDREFTISEPALVEFFDCLLSSSIIRHFNETEPFGSAGELVRDDLYANHLAAGLKRGA